MNIHRRAAAPGTHPHHASTPLAVLARVHRVLLDPASRDRGDVPGWVLVAVMTAGLVTALWLVADDQLTAAFTRAVGSVAKP